MKYIHGGWSHLFDDGPPIDLRFCFDAVAGVLVAMEILMCHGFEPATKAEIADVEDSLKHGNPGLLDSPENFGLTVSDVPPEWARVYPAVRRNSAL